MRAFQSSLEENPEWNECRVLQYWGAPGFQSSLEENPEWNMIILAALLIYAVFQSSLEENPEWNYLEEPCGISRTFQSSLEENPEWNRRGHQSVHGGIRFNPHSRKTPSGTRGVSWAGCARRRFNPHSRKTPSGTRKDWACHPRAAFQSSLEENPEWNFGFFNTGKHQKPVSILTRGKPRVEPADCRERGFVPCWFQSSLEENPEWNAV